MSLERVSLEITGDSGDLQKAALAAVAAIKSVGTEAKKQDRELQGAGRSARGLSTDLRGLDRDSRRAAQGVGGVDRASRSAATSVRALQTNLGLLKFPAMVAGAGAAAAELDAVAAGAVGLTAALGPAAGAIAAIPAVASAAAQGLGVLALATNGVMAALKAHGTEAAKAGTDASAAMESQHQKAEQLRSSTLSLADAQRQERQSREGLHEARAQAVRDLQDLKDAAASASISEEGGVIAVRRAREELNRVMRDPTASGLDAAEARNQLASAEESLKETRTQGARAQADYAKAETEGVKGMPAVVQARRQVADAERGVAQAAHQVAEAQHEATVQAAKSSASASAYQTALDKLSPSAQQFVKDLLAYKPVLDDLQERAAKGFFPGVESGLREAMHNLPVIKRITEDTARSLGALADKYGTYLGRKDVGQDLAAQGERNRVTITRVGDASLYLADATRQVTIAAGPLVDWMTTSAVHMARFVDEEAKAGRETNKLHDFFLETRQVLTEVGHTGEDVAVALFHIGASAKAYLGDDILQSLEQGAQSLRSWTESTAGQNDLRDYFLNAKPAVFETGRLVKDMGIDFLKLGAGPGSEKLVHQIRTDLLPAVYDLTHDLQDTFQPALVALLADLARLLDDLSGNGGALTQFATGLDKVISAADWLLKHVPGLKDVVGALTLAGLAIKALRFAGALTGVERLTAGYLGLQTQADRAAAAAGRVNATAATGGVAVATVPGVVGGGAPAASKAAQAGGVSKGGVLLPVGVSSPQAEQQGAKAAQGFKKGFREKLGNANTGKGLSGGALAAGDLSLPITLAIVGFTAGDAVEKQLKGAHTGNSTLDGILSGAGTGLKYAISPIRGAYAGAKLELQETAKWLGVIHDHVKVLSADGPKMDEFLKHFSAAKGEIEKAGDGIEKTGDAIKRALDPLVHPHPFSEWKNNLGALGQSTFTNLKQIRQTVDTQLSLVDGLFGSKTKSGQEHMRANLEVATNNVRQLMKDGTISTRDGMQEIARLMRVHSKAGLDVWGKNMDFTVTSIRQAMKDGKIAAKDGLEIIDNLFATELRQFGYTGRQIKLYLSGTPGHSGSSINPTTGGLDEGQAPIGNARGGLHQIGRAGDRGRDTIPMRLGGKNIIAGSGEVAAVFTGRQQQIVNGALASQGYNGLPGLFSSEKTPHYFEQGGVVSGGGSHWSRLISAANRVSGAHFPYHWGGGHEQPANFEPFDCSGAVSYITQQAGYKVPTSTSGNIGGWGFPRGSGAATIFYNSGHTFMRLGNRYWGTSGFARPNGGAGWFDRNPGAAYLGGFQQVHLPDLGDTSSSTGGPGQLKTPKVGGPDGPLKALLQAGLRGVTAGANARLSGITDQQFADGGTGGQDLEAGGDGAMSFDQLAALFSSVGLPAIFPWIALAESAGRPDIVNGIGATGLLQIYNHPDLVARFGDMRVPINNARAGKVLYDEAGLAPWVSSRRTWGSHLGRAGSQVASQFKLGGLVEAATGVLFGKKKADAPHVTGGHQTATTGGGVYHPSAARPAPSKKRTKALAALKGKLNIPSQFDSQFAGIQRTVDGLDGITLPHLDSVFGRLDAQALIDADSDSSTPDIVNQSGTTIDGKFIPGIDQAVGILNQELSALVAEQSMETAQRGIARAAITAATAAVKERKGIWDAQVAKVKKNADRIAAINREIISIDKQTTAIDKKKKKTPADKAEEKRLKAKRAPLASELHGLHVSQQMLTGEVEPSAATSALKQSTGPIGKTWADYSAQTEDLSTWQTRFDPFAGQLVRIGDTILDKRKEIEGWTGTLPPKPDASPTASDSVLQGLLLQQANDTIANLRLQVAQDAVFSGFSSRDLVGGLGGFARGIDFVPRTGLALVHEGEKITTNPRSAYGSQLGNYAGDTNRPMQVNVYIDGEPGMLTRAIRAEVDGVEARVNARVGRDTRQTYVAPGR